MSSLLELPGMGTLCFYLSILGLKMLAMSMLTARQRFRKGVFANPEDVINHKGKVKVDEDVERVRRAHLNDLENITVFMIVSIIYLMTKPSLFIAELLIRLFAISRLLHTLVYAVIVIPQPARALSFGVAYMITIYMAASSALHFMAYM